jgi:transcriptional regulator with XRE-family HTH domain
MPGPVSNKPSPLDASARRELERLQSVFGARLRALRHDRLLTIEQVAEVAGLHPNYLGSVERGERNLSLFNIWRIASGLGLPPASLMDELPERKVKPPPRKSMTW